MNYFVIVVSAIFLVIMLYIDFVMLFVGSKFRVGAPVVPILLLANLCLGIYYNLSIWYKLTNKTGYGALMSIAGAIITLFFNLYWIPRIGYMGSAWATLICYASMMVISYFLGQRFYQIHYNLRRSSLYIGLALVLYLISHFFHTHISLFRPHFSLPNVFLSTFLLIIFCSVVLIKEKPRFLLHLKTK